MLIKLTTQCQMQCPHCMEDAQPTGLMMTLDTFRQAVKFGTYIGCSHFVLSGGEPTENEHITEMCEWFDMATGCTFTIVSNGAWLKDEMKRQRVDWITRLHSYLGMQVYTHRQWYKDYDYVVSHHSDYEQYRKVIVDIDSTIYMQDLGRARTNHDAQREVERNPHFMSCLNATLAARQLPMPQGYGVALQMHGQLCKPSVDADGGVHLSESRLCPSVGNVVTDPFADIWSRMRRFRPCGQCAGYRRFMESQRPDIVRARQMIFGEQQTTE